MWVPGDQGQSALICFRAWYFPPPWSRLILIVWCFIGLIILQSGRCLSIREYLLFEVCLFARTSLSRLWLRVAKIAGNQVTGTLATMHWPRGSGGRKWCGDTTWQKHDREALLGKNNEEGKISSFSMILGPEGKCLLCTVSNEFWHDACNLCDDDFAIGITDPDMIFCCPHPSVITWLVSHFWNSSNHPPSSNNTIVPPLVHRQQFWC